jgi:uncharacterized protein (TIGR03435 family)
MEKMRTHRNILMIPIVLFVMQSVAVAQPRFDAASIRSTKDRKDESMVVNPGGLIYVRVSLKDCLEAAYGVKRYQISGPDWLESELFDISARTEGNHSTDQIMQMLQTLLAERFKVGLHREQKDLPVYALQVGKNGSKLRASENEGAPGMGPAAGGIGFQRFSMADFASKFLSRIPPIGRPVLDKTGLAGHYDFTLSLAPRADAGIEDTKRAAAEEGFSLFVYALEQLGLRLEAQRALIDMIIVDQAEKVPTEN